MGIDRTSRRKSLARIALAAFVTTLVLPWVLSTHRVGDRDIVGLAVAADHQMLSLTAVADRDGHDHCGVCHWLRTVGDTASPKPAPLPAASDASSVLNAGVAPGSNRLVAADAPSRAPPLPA